MFFRSLGWNWLRSTSRVCFHALPFHSIPFHSVPYHEVYKHEITLICLNSSTSHCITYIRVPCIQTVTWMALGWDSRRSANSGKPRHCCNFVLNIGKQQQQQQQQQRRFGWMAHPSYNKWRTTQKTLCLESLISLKFHWSFEGPRNVGIPTYSNCILCSNMQAFRHKLQPQRLPKNLLLLHG